MNLPPPPPPKTDPSPAGPPSTRELPLAPPTPEADSGATQVLPPPAPPEPMGPTGALGPLGPVVPQATGPVDHLPGPPPVAGATPATSTRVTRRPRDRAALAGLGLGLAAVVLLELGLLLRFGGAQRFWSTVPLWSAFATVTALLALPAFLMGSGAAAGRVGRLAQAGMAGLAVFWLLVVLPVADTDRGFVLTAALGCLGAGLWTAPSRRD